MAPSLRRPTMLKRDVKPQKDHNLIPIHNPMFLILFPILNPMFLIRFPIHIPMFLILFPIPNPMLLILFPIHNPMFHIRFPIHNPMFLIRFPTHNPMFLTLCSFPRLDSTFSRDYKGGVAFGCSQSSCFFWSQMLTDGDGEGEEGE